MFDYHGAEDADRIIIAMGSVCEAAIEAVDYLNANGEKTGILTVHLYRPFSIEHFFKYIPKTVKKVAVLDRTKEPGAIGDPLYLPIYMEIREKQDDYAGSERVGDPWLVTVPTSLVYLESRKYPLPMEFDPATPLT